jgi:hypothetical protein
MSNIVQRMKRIEVLENATDGLVGKIICTTDGAHSPAELGAMKSRGAIVVHLSPEDINL